jgi:hypothetical protein
MNAIWVLMAGAALACVAAAQAPATEPEQRLHTVTSFDLVVHAPLSAAMPLFGPEGERAWAGKHWDPQFIYPQPGQDGEGAVFSISHGAMTSTWVATLFDTDARHFQYVYFLPGVMVATIDVHFKPMGADTTGVNVTYARTALTAEGNEHVKKMTESDQGAGREWQQALDAYLAVDKPPARP